MNLNDNKLYTNISQTFALMRCGASFLMQHSKSWTIDGILTDSVSPYSFVPAYNIHELMNVKTKHGIEIPITGNSKNDIAFATFKIISEMMKENKFPFRIWGGDCYIEHNSSDRFMIDCLGKLRMIRKNGRGDLFEADVPEYYEMEEFTGFFDSYNVPIFRNDAILINDKKYKVSKSLEWQLDLIEKSSEEFSFTLYEKRKECKVLGSSRMSIDMLDKIVKLVR